MGYNQYLFPLIITPHACLFCRKLGREGNFLSNSDLKIGWKIWRKKMPETIMVFMLIVTSIFKKSWSLWLKAWLASSLLEQKLKNNSGKVPSNWSIIFVQTPTTTRPKKIRGKYSQEPQHNPTFLKKLLCEDWRGIAPSV
jgi:hypothetical protein